MKPDFKNFVETHRWPIIFILGIGLMVFLFVFHGYNATYKLYGVPVSKYTFLDLQLITGSAESLEDGFNPAIENPSDPKQREFNYPKIWFIFLRLGLGDGALIPMGILSLALFGLAIVVFPATQDKLTLLILTLTAFSGAFMLAYERVNVDVLFFTLLVIVLWLRDRNYITPALILFLLGILFKIFPFFALALFLEKENKRSLWFPIAIIGFTLLYFVFTWHDMQTIFAVTQKGDDVSYGLLLLPGLLHDKYNLATATTYPIFYGLAFLLILVAFWLGTKYQAGGMNIKTKDLRAFWTGAGIYIGTFWLGNNWDYRLIFLFFCIPALSQFVQTKEHSFVKIMARITLVVLLLSCWYLPIRFYAKSIREFTFLLDEIANWTLYFSLAYLFIASLPNWLTNPKEWLGTLIQIGPARRNKQQRI